MKLHERITKIEKLEQLPGEIPYKVWTTFSENKDKFMSIFGSQITFNDGDYKSIEEVRESLDWLVDQLGGKITWRAK